MKVALIIEINCSFLYFHYPRHSCFFKVYFELIHCGLMIPYGDTELCQHSGNGLFPDGIKPLPEPRDIDFSLGRFQGIHWRVISQVLYA